VTVVRGRVLLAGIGGRKSRIVVARQLKDTDGCDSMVNGCYKTMPIEPLIILSYFTMMVI